MPQVLGDYLRVLLLCFAACFAAVLQNLSNRFYPKAEPTVPSNCYSDATVGGEPVLAWASTFTSLRVGQRFILGAKPNQASNASAAA
jgi:hypothetical protein